MKNKTPTDACSWLPHRFNVVPTGIKGHRMPARFVDSLADAEAARQGMLRDGAEHVDVYDTVDGVFHDLAASPIVDWMSGARLAVVPAPTGAVLGRDEETEIEQERRTR